MTTIAYKDGVMAADTRISAYDRHHSEAVKIARNAKGDLCGASGNHGFMARFLHWFENGEKGEPPSAEDKDSHYDALIVRAKTPHQAFTINQQTLSPITGRHYAIGSGNGFAKAAMEAGASAVEAVKIACRFDNNSGDDITVLPHKGPPVTLHLKLTWLEGAR